MKKTEYDIMDNILSINNSNVFDKERNIELNTPNKGKFEVSLNGNYTDKDLLSCKLSKGISGSKLIELCALINSQQDEGVRNSTPVVLSSDAIYTPFAGRDKAGRQMDFMRNETYTNDVEVDGNIETQEVHRSWFTLTSAVPRKAVSIKNFTF